MVQTVLFQKNKISEKSKKLKSKIKKIKFSKFEIEKFWKFRIFVLPLHCSFHFHGIRLF